VLSFDADVEEYFVYVLSFDADVEKYICSALMMMSRSIHVHSCKMIYGMI
jgi:hypothetical protein